MKGMGAIVIAVLVLWLLSKRAKAQPIPDEPTPLPVELSSHINWTKLPPSEVVIGSYVTWEATVTNITDTYMRYTFDGGCYGPDGVYHGKFGGFKKNLTPGQTWSQSSVKRLIQYGEYVLSMRSNGVEITHTVMVV